MIYVGLDPGSSGAVAFIYSNDLIEVFPLEGLNLAETLKERKVEYMRCCLEQVHSMPKQGVASTFTFGMKYGYLKGMLEALGVSYQEVKPQKWKAEFGLNTDKQKSIEVCKRLFPDVNLKRTERCRKDDDNMAEALLMAEYARRKL